MGKNFSPIVEWTRSQFAVGGAVDLLRSFVDSTLAVVKTACS